MSPTMVPETLPCYGVSFKEHSDKLLCDNLNLGEESVQDRASQRCEDITASVTPA